MSGPLCEGDATVECAEATTTLHAACDADGPETLVVYQAPRGTMRQTAFVYPSHISGTRPVRQVEASLLRRDLQVEVGGVVDMGMMSTVDAASADVDCVLVQRCRGGVVVDDSDSDVELVREEVAAAVPPAAVDAPALADSAIDMCSSEDDDGFAVAMDAGDGGDEGGPVGVGASFQGPVDSGGAASDAVLPGSRKRVHALLDSDDEVIDAAQVSPCSIAPGQGRQDVCVPATPRQRTLTGVPAGSLSRPRQAAPGGSTSMPTVTDVTIEDPPVGRAVRAVPHQAAAPGSTSRKLLYAPLVGKEVGGVRHASGLGGEGKEQRSLRTCVESVDHVVAMAPARRALEDSVRKGMAERAAKRSVPRHTVDLSAGAQLDAEAKAKNKHRKEQHDARHARRRRGSPAGGFGDSGAGPSEPSRGAMSVDTGAPGRASLLAKLAKKRRAAAEVTAGCRHAPPTSRSPAPDEVAPSAHARAARASDAPPTGARAPPSPTPDPRGVPRGVASPPVEPTEEDRLAAAIDAVMMDDRVDGEAVHEVVDGMEGAEQEIRQTELFVKLMDDPKSFDECVSVLRLAYVVCHCDDI